MPLFCKILCFQVFTEITKCPASPFLFVRHIYIFFFRSSEGRPDLFKFLLQFEACECLFLAGGNPEYYYFQHEKPRGLRKLAFLCVQINERENAARRKYSTLFKSIRIFHLLLFFAAACKFLLLEHDFLF